MSSVCLALNDQIFTFGVTKSGAGPFSLDGLLSNGGGGGGVCRLGVRAKNSLPGPLRSFPGL